MYCLFYPVNAILVHITDFITVKFTVFEARLLRLITKKSIGATTGAGGDAVGRLSSRRPIHDRHPPRAVRAAATPRVPRAQPAGGHGCSLDAWGGSGASVGYPNLGMSVLFCVEAKFCN